MAKSKKNTPVIATLVQILRTKAAKRTSGGMTVPELVSDLHNKTGRKEESLFYTVRAQLSRLPKEKKVKITRRREGQVVRYAAAA